MKRYIVLFACFVLMCFASSAQGQDAKEKSDTKAADKPASLTSNAEAQRSARYKVCSGAGV